VLNFNFQLIMKKFEIWRIYTAFLYFGHLDVFYPLTLHFVWQHMAQLEKASCQEPEEFLILVGFGVVTLIGVYMALGMSTRMLGHNLATYLVYIWSRTFEGMDVNFLDLITLKAETMPWFFCLQSYILEKEFPYADFIGIVVGHLYHYLKSKRFIRVPQRIKTWVKSSKTINKHYSQFREALD